MEEDKVLRILCSDSISKCAKNLGIKWLIGAPFLPCTVISSLNCVHTRHSDPFSLDFAAESDFLQEILPKGVEIVGALVINDNTGVDDVLKAVDLVSELRKHILRKQSERGIIACSGKPKSIDSIQYFMCDNTQKPQLEAFTTVMHEEKSTQCFWDAACLLHCQISLNLPVYLSSSVTLETQCSQLQQEFARNLQNPKTVFQAEREDNDTKKHSPILRFKKIDLNGSYESVEILNTGGDISNKSSSFCSSLCSPPLYLSATSGVQIPKPINVTILQSSPSDIEAHAPTIEYYPAKEDIRFILLSLKLDVFCISSKESSLADSVSFLLIPALVKQFSSMCKYISHKMKQSKFRAYHFCPPGILHPVTVIYDLSLGETELNQVALREKIHACLNLPLDRPMVRVANALSLYVSQSVNNAQEISSRKKGNNPLTNVHLGLPSSGVVSGQVSLVQGSYEYYHYLQDDINDNGWGCAYRSLQTIISWFRLQQYSTVKVPSHREIQETLVEIGDKEATFIGSKEWIGAIELSFVLDKLLGVSCKIINVRSGAELPEKCRELSLHFETQGTPVMIGGGVLAYTLLGVDYNHLTGDCAFLILDPHYTGADDLRSIQNGGWCGWKKAVSSKGKEFFLRDKFYNLLLPQRPNMV